MKKLVFTIFFTTAMLTPLITVHAEDKGAAQKKPEVSLARSITEQIKAVAQALGIAWGGPTMIM